MSERETPTRRALLRAAGAAGVGLLAGCADSAAEEPATATPTATPAEGIPYDVSVDRDLADWGRYDPDWSPPEGPPPAAYEVETLVENLEIPWDLSVAPTGELFVSERTGRLLALGGDGTRTVAAPGDAIDAEALPPGSEERPWTVEGGEGGLLGIAVHPAYPDPPLVYAYYTADTEAGRRNRVVAVDAESDGAWPVVEDIPAATYHNGGRIAFGPTGDLWVTTGDADPSLENPATIRDPGTLNGAILRVRPDGSPPADPPGHGGDPRVYTYGHRNPQAITWLPDGTPVAAEHGPGGGDEVALLEAGADYGWPDVRRGEGFGDYADSDYHPPVASAPAWAPSGGVFYTGEVAGLSGRLLLGGLISQQVVAVTLADSLGEGHATYHDAGWFDGTYRAASDPLLTDEYGRIRHLEQGPGGELYAITSNRDGRAEGAFPTERDDRLLRIRPG